MTFDHKITLIVTSLYNFDTVMNRNGNSFGKRDLSKGLRPTF